MKRQMFHLYHKYHNNFNQEKSNQIQNVLTMTTPLRTESDAMTLLWKGSARESVASLFAKARLRSELTHR